MKNENDSLLRGIEALIDNFIVRRDAGPEIFRGIVNNQKFIRKYMMENFGYRLRVDTEIAKLEKIPYYKREWLAIDVFKDELDYALYMALLANLEKKSSDDGFLLSVLIEDVRNFMTDIFEIDWKLRHQRESFARVLLYAQGIGIIRHLDGDIENFRKFENAEVLYRTTNLVKYQFRNLTKPVDSFVSEEELLHDGFDKDNPKHNLFRKLLFEPVVFFNELTEEENDYLMRNYQHVKMQISQYTPYSIERMFQCVYLVRKEKKNSGCQYPNSRRNISNMVAQVAYTLQQELKNRVEKPMGLLILKNSEFEELLTKVKENFSAAWSTDYRERTTFNGLKYSILKYMLEWKFAEYDEDSMILTIYPVFIRTVGEYDADLRDYIDQENVKRRGAYVN